MVKLEKVKERLNMLENKEKMAQRLATAIVSNTPMNKSIEETRKEGSAVSARFGPQIGKKYKDGLPKGMKPTFPERLESLENALRSDCHGSVPESGPTTSMPVKGTFNPQ